MILSEPRIKAVSFAQLIRKGIPENEFWIGGDVLPKGTKMIFGGGAGIGKSMLMLELARGLALGSAPFDYPNMPVPRPAKVLIIEHELKEYGMIKRGAQMYKSDEELDAIASNIEVISGETDINFSDAAGFQLLCDIVAWHKPEVLFLDPIGKMHYNNENDAAGMAKMFHQLDQLILIGRSQGMSLIFSHHFGKPPKGEYAKDYDPLDIYNFRGSSKFKDDPDTRVSVNQTKFLAKPYKAWEIQTRWLTRQGEGPPDLLMTVNEQNDLRVRFRKEMKHFDGIAPLPPITSATPKVIPPPAPGTRGLKLFAPTGPESLEPSPDVPPAAPTALLPLPKAPSPRRLPSLQPFPAAL